MFGGAGPVDPGQQGNFMGKVMSGSTDHMRFMFHNFSRFKMTDEEGNEVHLSQLETTVNKLAEMKNLPNEVKETLSHFKDHIDELGALTGAMQEEASYLANFLKQGMK